MEKDNTTDLHEEPTTSENESVIGVGDTIRLKGLSSKDSPRMVVVGSEYRAGPGRVFTCLWFSYDFVPRTETFLERVLRKVVLKKSKKRR